MAADQVSFDVGAGEIFGLIGPDAGSAAAALTETPTPASTLARSSTSALPSPSPATARPTPTGTRSTPASASPSPTSTTTTVPAGATLDDSAANATVHWDLLADTVNGRVPVGTDDVVMTRGDATGSWVARIGTFPQQGTVYYQVIASDAGGNTTYGKQFALPVQEACNMSATTSSDATASARVQPEVRMTTMNFFPFGSSR